MGIYSSWVVQKKILPHSQKGLSVSVWDVAKHSVWQPPTVSWGSFAGITNINQCKCCPTTSDIRLFLVMQAFFLRRLTGFSSLINTGWRGCPARSFTLVGQAVMIEACCGLCQSQLMERRGELSEGLEESVHFKSSLTWKVCWWGLGSFMWSFVYRK